MAAVEPAQVAAELNDELKRLFGQLRDGEGDGDTARNHVTPSESRLTDGLKKAQQQRALSVVQAGSSATSNAAQKRARFAGDASSEDDDCSPAQMVRVLASWEAEHAYEIRRAEDLPLERKLSGDRLSLRPPASEPQSRRVSFSNAAVEPTPSPKISKILRTPTPFRRDRRLVNFLDNVDYVDKDDDEDDSEADEAAREVEVESPAPQTHYSSGLMRKLTPFPVKRLPIESDDEDDDDDEKSSESCLPDEATREAAATDSSPLDVVTPPRTILPDFVGSDLMPDVDVDDAILDDVGHTFEEHNGVRDFGAIQIGNKPHKRDASKPCDLQLKVVAPQLSVTESSDDEESEAKSLTGNSERSLDGIPEEADQRKSPEPNGVLFQLNSPDLDDALKKKVSFSARIEEKRYFDKREKILTLQVTESLRGGRKLSPSILKRADSMPPSNKVSMDESVAPTLMHTESSPAMGRPATLPTTPPPTPDLAVTTQPQPTDKITADPAATDASHTSAGVVGSERGGGSGGALSSLGQLFKRFAVNGPFCCSCYYSWNLRQAAAKENHVAPVASTDETDDEDDLPPLPADALARAALRKDSIQVAHKRSSTVRPPDTLELPATSH